MTVSTRALVLKGFVRNQNCALTNNFAIDSDQQETPNFAPVAPNYDDFDQDWHLTTSSDDTTSDMWDYNGN